MTVEKHSNEKLDSPERAKAAALERVFRGYQAIPAFAVVALGVFFVTGWTHQAEFDDAFGIKGLVDHDFNSLAAVGAGVFTAGFIVSALLYGLTYTAIDFAFPRRVERVIAAKTNSILQNSIEKRGKENTRNLVINFLYQLHIAKYALVPAILIFCSIVFGISSAGIFIYASRNAVSGDCTSCFSFELADKSLRGVRIGSDKERIAILTSATEVLVVPWADIKKISKPSKNAKVRPVPPASK